MIEVEACSYGPEVARLMQGSTGHIAAILSNCIYLQSYEGYVIALVGDKAADGPLSLRIRELARCTAALRGRENVAFSAGQEAINIGGLVRITLSPAVERTPTLPANADLSEKRTRAIRALAEAIAGAARLESSARGPGSGLAGMVRRCLSSEHADSVAMKPASGFPECFVAALRIEAVGWHSEQRESKPAEMILGRLIDGILGFVDGWRNADEESTADMLTSLLGLGEGLTPSGDDLVCGIIATLVWQARLGLVDTRQVERLAHRLNGLTHRTNLISARLLHYATNGILYAPAMQLGEAIVSGNPEQVEQPASRLFEIGRSSGLDMATGMLIGAATYYWQKTEGPLARASASGERIFS